MSVTSFYAYAAFSLYFASSFFPGNDPVVQQLNAAVLFAIGFIIQGLSLGGEYGTGATYLTEVADEKHRGFSLPYLQLRSLSTSQRAILSVTPP